MLYFRRSGVPSARRVTYMSTWGSRKLTKCQKFTKCSVEKQIVTAKQANYVYCHLSGLDSPGFLSCSSSATNSMSVWNLKDAVVAGIYKGGSRQSGNLRDSTSSLHLIQVSEEDRQNADMEQIGESQRHFCSTIKIRGRKFLPCAPLAFLDQVTKYLD